MRPALWTIVLATALAAGPRAAGDVTVLASGATQGALTALQPTLARDGHRAQMQFETSQVIARRLAAGEIPDVLVAQASAIDQAIKDGNAIATTRATLGSIGIGAAASKAGALPDVSTLDAMKAAILRADLVVVSQGASGGHVEKAFADLGIADQIKGKLAREPRGDDVMKRLASATNGIGFTMISEIKFGESHGARYAGPLPAAIQLQTSYDAIVMSRARDQAAARAFLATMATPAAQTIFRNFGWSGR